MQTRLIISPQVRDVIRQGRIDEKALTRPDRPDLPFGLTGEDLRSEGYVPTRRHSSGPVMAREAERF